LDSDEINLARDTNPTREVKLSMEAEEMSQIAMKYTT
jgi:hypothetical protein